MSHLVVPKTIAVSEIPLTRRITEIMIEKGKSYYNISAMAERIGIHRETYRMMLKGEREIYTFELEKIAKDLKLPPERITQVGIIGKVSELHRLFDDLTNNNRALEIAQSLLSVALGDTEQCDANTYLGRAYFELQEYELAHQHRLKAYEYAQKIQEKYNETDRLHDTLKFLITSFTVRKDYSNAREIIDQVRDIFKDHPARYGALCYSLAMIAFDSGNFEKTKTQLIQSLECYRQTNNIKEIGRAIHCVAFIEYKMENYAKSKELFEEAITMLESHLEPRLTAIKDYIKVLLKLNEMDRAQELISYALEHLSLLDLPVLKTKFILLNAITEDDPTSAEIVLSIDSSSDYHKLLACKILMNHYSRKDDAFSLLRYYKVMEGVPFNQSGVIGEGDL